MANEWLAWAAGVIDGEGCIQLVRQTSGKRNTRWNVRLSVGNTDPRMLMKLRELFGGSLFANRRIEGYLPMWSWVTGCVATENALRLMHPWLIVKKDQADIALKSREMMQKKTKKRQFTEEEVGLFVQMESDIKAAKKRQFLELVA